MNAVSDTAERVALYYREGSSDKVYQAAIEPAGGHFVVNFAYGRRGATLTTGTKTSSPVDYDTARKIHAKLVGEKKAKGYTEGADGTPYEHTDRQVSGIRYLPVGVLIRRAVRALGVTLGFLFADELGVDFPGRVIIHRRRGLRPGRQSRAPPSVCEVDDEMAAGRFNRGLI